MHRLPEGISDQPSGHCGGMIFGRAVRFLSGRALLSLARKRLAAVDRAVVPADQIGKSQAISISCNWRSATIETCGAPNLSLAQ